jgi:tyrosyl-tRNA synthetase
MRLTADIFREYVKKLNEQGVEIIHSNQIENKLNNDEHITVYIGYEPSGSIHLGHMTGILMLEYFANYENVHAISLISTFHAKANQKTLDYTLLRQMRNAQKNLNIEHILSSNNDIPTNSKRNNFMYLSQYLNLLNEQLTKIRFKKLIKATAFFERAHYEDLAITQIMYPAYQANDIDYLSIDIAIGGSDQRKIHMFHSDNFRRRVCYIHLPILPVAGGTKMSKSNKLSCINFTDDNFIDVYNNYITENPQIKKLFNVININEDIIDTVYPRYKL